MSETPLTWSERSTVLTPTSQGLSKHPILFCYTFLLLTSLDKHFFNSFFLFITSVFLFPACFHLLPQISHPSVQVSETGVHRPCPFHYCHCLVPNLFQEHTGMLQLLLEVDRALGDSHPFGHNGDDLHSPPFQDRTCGASLGYIPASRRELTFFLTPANFFRQLLYFNDRGTRRCLTARTPLPRWTRFAPHRCLLRRRRFQASCVLAIRRAPTSYFLWF